MAGRERTGDGKEGKGREGKVDGRGLNCVPQGGKVAGRGRGRGRGGRSIS